MLNNHELVSLIGAYGRVHINDNTVSADTFAQYLRDMMLNNAVTNIDMVTSLNIFLQLASTDQRAIDIISILGRYVPAVKKDLFQVMACYYFSKNNIKGLTDLITNYKNMYGEDEHSIIAELNIMLLDREMKYSIADMKILVDKASAFLL